MNGLYENNKPEHRYSPSFIIQQTQHANTQQLQPIPGHHIEYPQYQPYNHFTHNHLPQQLLEQINSKTSQLYPISYYPGKNSKSNINDTNGAQRRSDINRLESRVSSEPESGVPEFGTPEAEKMFKRIGTMYTTPDDAYNRGVVYCGNGNNSSTCVSCTNTGYSSEVRNLTGPF